MSADYSLYFFETQSGRCPVREYLKGRSKAVRSAAGWLLTCLEQHGPSLGRPDSGYLEDGIHELRVIVNREHHRILYFFEGTTIVATNAFLKKSGKVPRAEIEKARAAKGEWLAREGK